MGVALGIKAGVWNTGIEGYMYLGAIGAAIAGIPNLGIPKFFHILLVFLCAMVFAGVWGFIPGVLRARVGVNEVTSTIMLNYVAIYLTTWFVSDPQPLAEPDSFYPMSKQFADSALLPILKQGTSFHPGVFIGIGICILFSFILFHTSFGFNSEVDFIATKADSKMYVQVTESMTSEEVRKRELAPLQKIRDNYEKMVLSLEPGLETTYEGIRSVQLIDWLLAE